MSISDLRNQISYLRGMHYSGIGIADSVVRKRQIRVIRMRTPLS